MDKTKIYEKYKKEEDRLLISKLIDKISSLEKTNKIQITDFVSPVELQILKDALNMINYKNYQISGGIKEAQRNIIILFPQKLEELFENNVFDYNSIFDCIRVTNNQETYEHKVYLGGIIKLGIKREKIGDIITYENGADIIVSKDVSKFLITNLTELTRFQKSKVEIINLNQITKKEQEYKEEKIIVSSIRLDNIISELAKTSRSKALDIIKQERVFINYKNETKPTKTIQLNDIITIRGIGKFIVIDLNEHTRSGKNIILLNKFV
ncbi:MAG: hypothetical protein IJ890_03155 [Clostridia bacterium]|nr:hypothetical protein [Clostridia bacterium]